MPFRIRMTLLVLGLLVAAILLVPLVWPVPPLEGTVPADELIADDATWIDADGVRLHAIVREDGDDDGPGFVFVHGFLSHGRSFAPLMDAAPDLAPAIAYDRPGFGLSDRPASDRDPNPYGPEAQVDHVLVAMDRLGVDSAVVIGSSAGGAVALRVAAEHPQRVAGLVLIAPAVYETGGAPVGTRWLLRTPQMERLGPLFMRELGREPGERFLRSAYADHERIPEPSLEAYRQATSVPDWDRGLWEVTKASRDGDVEALLPRVGVPTLVLSGDADAVVPVESSTRVAAALPEAELRVLEGCGHLPQEECPEATAAEVTSWARARGLVGRGPEDAVVGSGW